MVKVKPYNSKHFQLDQLAEGVYAAINAEVGWAGCNAGIIDLGERTLVYDAFMTPEAAKELRDAAEILTNRPVQAVINSHYHNDHIWGNQAFSDEADIISDAKTRQLIISEGEKEIKEFTELVHPRLKSLEEEVASTKDKFLLRTLKLMLVYYQAIHATLPILQIRLPNITFTGTMTFYGSKRTAELICYEGGHCASDAILYLPQDGIVFMEDLLFCGYHPYLLEGIPERHQEILREVKKLEAKTFVPGHGPVGDASSLDWLDGYIDCLHGLAQNVISQGGGEQEIEKTEIPDEYQQLLYPVFFMRNLRYIYQQQIGKASR